MNARTLIIVSLSLALAVVAGGCGQQPPEEGFVEDVATLMPEDPAVPPTYTLAPPGSIVVYGDEHVVAARIDLVPGDEIPEHELDGAVLYGIDDADIRVIRNGEERLEEFERGEVLALDAGRFAFANPITDDGEPTADQLLFITRSEVSLPDLPEEYAPFGPAEADDGVVLFEDETRRVVEVQLDARSSIALDVVPLRLVYAVTDAELSFADEVDAGNLVVLESGEADARTARDIKLENVGDNPATVVLFEYRG
jgi:hypothetical protein